MTNGELILAQPILMELLQAKINWKPKAALRLRRIYRAIQEPAEDLEQLRQDLLKKYGCTGEQGELLMEEDGNVIFPNDEAREKFIKEWKETGDLEVEVAEPFAGLTVSQLPNRIELSVAELDALLTAGILEE